MAGGRSLPVRSVVIAIVAAVEASETYAQIIRVVS